MPFSVPDIMYFIRSSSAGLPCYFAHNIDTFHGVRFDYGQRFKK